MTEGFSGSDLKSFCVAAGYQPIRELLDSEKSQEAKEPHSGELVPDMDAKAEEEEVNVQLEHSLCCHEVSCSLAFL